MANRGGIVVMPPRKTKVNPRLDSEKRIKQLKIAILRIHVGKFIGQSPKCSKMYCLTCDFKMVLAIGNLKVLNLSPYVKYF